MNLPKLLTVKEVATVLQMSTDWVRDHVSGRRGPRIRAINAGTPHKPQWRVREEDLAIFIEQHLTEAPDRGRGGR